MQCNTVLKHDLSSCDLISELIVEKNSQGGILIDILMKKKLSIVRGQCYKK